MSKMKSLIKWCKDNDKDIKEVEKFIKRCNTALYRKDGFERTNVVHLMGDKLTDIEVLEKNMDRFIKLSMKRHLKSIENGIKVQADIKEKKEKEKLKNKG